MKMDYKPEHAKKALAILTRLLPDVAQHQEYSTLVEILGDSSRWHEAHDCFTAIRTNITLRCECHKPQTLDHFFASIAENAAKTAYNCSGASAPFDNDSFNRLLASEKRFLEKKNENG